MPSRAPRRAAHLEQLEQPLGVVLHDGGKERPERAAVRRPDHRPAALADVQKAAAGQYLERLANGEAADSAIEGDLGLARKVGARLQLAGDQPGEALDDPRDGGLALDLELGWRVGSHDIRLLAYLISLTRIDVLGKQLAVPALVLRRSVNSMFQARIR
jgi:hypothetical protein